MGAGDDHCKSLGIELLDTESKDSIAKSDQSDTVAAVGWMCEKNMKGDIKVTMADCDGPSLSVYAVLRKKKDDE